MDEESAREISKAFLDAFNNRDADAWVAAFHADGSYRASVLTRTQACYRGSAELRKFIEEVIERGIQHRGRLSGLRMLDEDRFLLTTDVMIGGDVVTPAAMLVRAEDGKIVEATAYLSEDETLISLGMVPG
jgi:ketosteroid isomerase-like protein